MTDRLRESNSALQWIVVFLSPILTFFYLTVFILICTLGWLVASHFQVIATNVDQYRPSLLVPELVNQQLIRWKKQFVLTVECCGVWNKCFDLVLLIHISCTFIFIISRSFFILMIFFAFHDVNVLAVLSAVESFVHLWITCYLADYIREMVFPFKSHVLLEQT